MRSKVLIVSSSLFSDKFSNTRQSLVDHWLSQQHYYDRFVIPLPFLQQGDEVRVRNNNIWQQGIIKSKSNTPRSYNVALKQV